MKTLTVIALAVALAGLWSLSETIASQANLLLEQDSYIDLLQDQVIDLRAELGLLDDPDAPSEQAPTLPLDIL